MIIYLKFNCQPGLCLLKKNENFTEESLRLKELEKEEPLLKENPKRFVVLPIRYPDIWQFYKKAEGKGANYHEGT